MKQFFYAVGHDRRGPVSETSLLELFRLRTVTAQTLVWCDGMPDWQSLAEVFPHWLAESATAPPQAGAENAVCVVSGRLLPKADMIRFGDVWVSPESRDVYLQQLHQGSAATSDMVPADMWQRFGAVMLDLVLIGLIPAAATMVLAVNSADPEQAGEDLAGLIAIGWLLCMVIYETAAVAGWGTTLGKRILGLEVARIDGSRPRFGAALGRALIKYVLGQFCSGIVSLISIVKAIRDKPWHQSLHDQSSKTYVIRRRR